MDSYDIKRLALVLAVQAEIEGMKIDNLMRGAGCERYHAKDFQDKAEELRNLAYAANEQL